MGTSTNYDAPTTPQWASLKNTVTRTAGQSDINQDSIRGIIGKYLGANGGAEGITNGSIGGVAKRIGNNIASFASSVNSFGFDEALRSNGLGDLIGKPVREILYSLVDLLSGSANTLNDVDAREALSMLMEEKLRNSESAEDVEMEFKSLMNEKSFSDFLSMFYGYYIYCQFCRVFYGRLVKSKNEKIAKSLLSQILDYIRSTLRNKTYKNGIAAVDLAGNEGRRLVESIMQETFEVFGG